MSQEDRTQALAILAHPANFLGIMLTIALVAAFGYFIIVQPIQNYFAARALEDAARQMLSTRDEIAKRPADPAKGGTVVVGRGTWLRPMNGGETCMPQFGGTMRTRNMEGDWIMVRYEPLHHRSGGTSCPPGVYEVQKSYFLEQSGVYLEMRRKCTDAGITRSAYDCRRAWR